MCGEKTFSRCPYLQCRELPETANLTWKETALSGRARGGRCVDACSHTSPPTARVRETCLHFSSGEMCEEKTQAIISCNGRMVNNKRER